MQCQEETTALVTGRANQVLIFCARKDNKTRARCRTDPMPIHSAEHNRQRKEPAHPLLAQRELFWKNCWEKLWDKTSLMQFS